MNNNANENKKLWGKKPWSTTHDKYPDLLLWPSISKLLKRPAL